MTLTIFCANLECRCQRRAHKRRYQAGPNWWWGNECSACRTLYSAPPPALCFRRQRQRRERRRIRTIENLGQLRLFG